MPAKRRLRVSLSRRLFVTWRRGIARTPSCLRCEPDDSPMLPKGYSVPGKTILRQVFESTDGSYPREIRNFVMLDARRLQCILIVVAVRSIRPPKLTSASLRNVETLSVRSMNFLYVSSPSRHCFLFMSKYFSRRVNRCWKSSERRRCLPSKLIIPSLNAAYKRMRSLTIRKKQAFRIPLANSLEVT